MPPPVRSRLLRLGQCGGDAFQFGADLGQLHFGGGVDRMIAIPVIPGRIEAAAKVNRDSE